MTGRLILLVGCFVVGNLSFVETGGAVAATGARIADLAEPFLGVPYAENTLIGGPERAEQLVADQSRFDCFTFLDTIEALRLSASDTEFTERLRRVRYRGGQVDYQQRRHFFSDWVADSDRLVDDVTREVGQSRVVAEIKHLNLRDDGSLWLPGIAIVPRMIDYIPVSLVDGQILAALQSGDYLGVYSEASGLDVSHTGIVVKEGDRILFRHASSRAEVRRVVDDVLMDYLAGKPGIVVYRARPIPVEP